MDHPSVEELIVRARSDDDALGVLLEKHRAFLLAMARRDLRAGIQPRVDASDIVQQSFLEAQQSFRRFRGAEAAEVLVWLRRIVQRNIHDAVRRHTEAERRAVGREEPLPDLESKLAARQSSPSRRAMRNQDRTRLERALGQLPDDQARAVRMRHIEGRSLQEIAAAMDRTPVAAASLIKRGMTVLRKVLDERKRA